VSTTTVALVYIRVSTARQAADGVSLEAQEARARAHAEKNGWAVAGVFKDEGISGKDAIAKRPGLKSLLESSISLKAKNINAVVVVYSVSRLSRSQKLLWNLLDDRDGAGLAVSSVTEPFDTTTPMGRAMLGMIAVFAALEADMVSERTKDALAELKMQGKRLGRRPSAELAPDTVRLVKDLYATGLYTHVSLTEELMRRGVLTPMGKSKWYKRQIQICLNSP
jgi:site-specific DNA recombinase